MPRAYPDSSTKAEGDQQRKATCVRRSLRDRSAGRIGLKVKAKVMLPAFEIAKVFARTNASRFSVAKAHLEQPSARSIQAKLKPQVKESCL